MPEQVVSVTGLVKSFAGRGIGRRAEATLAVSDVSFSVERGGALAIVGESGSGKTTVARCLVGLEAPTAGEVAVCGESWSDAGASKEARRRRAGKIQLVFQDPYQSLDPRQKVGNALDEALRVQGVSDAPERDRRRVELLERVGLSAEVGDAYPRVLSGGQRQRIAIARALAAEPEVIVFDEAASALDVSIQAQILNLIADLRDTADVTTIFISHDLAVVRHVSEQVVVMCRGEIVERGPTAEVLASPTDPYTAMLIASVPHIGWNPGEVLRAERALGAEDGSNGVGRDPSGEGSPTP